MCPHSWTLVAHSETELQFLCSSFAKACSEFGLKISLGKTVALSQGSPAPQTFSINGTTLSMVDKFSYLGSTIFPWRWTRLPPWQGRNRNHIRPTSPTCLEQHRPLHQIEEPHLCGLCDKHPSVLQWVLDHVPPSRASSQLIPFPMPALHPCYLWCDHVPNASILRLTGATDMFTMLRQRRLRWVGHVYRQVDGRIPNDIIYGILDDAPRPRSWPRLRYKDVWNVISPLLGYQILLGS